MKKTKIAFIVFCFLASLLFVSLVYLNIASKGNTVDSSSKSNSKDIKRIVLLAHVYDNPYWQVIKQGAEDAAKKRGCVIEYKGPQSPNIGESTKLLDMSVAAKVDGILTYVQEEDKYAPYINNAILNGVPVITIDTDAESSNRIAYIGTNNIKAGKTAAETLIKKTGGVGEIGVIMGGATTKNQVERVEGFESSIKENSKMVVVEKESSDSFVTEAEIMTKKILNAHPNVKSLFCASALDGIGAAKGVSDMNLTGKITIVCFDNLDETLQAINNGSIYATVVQKPYDMGYEGVNAIMDDIEGKKIQTINYTDVSVLTKDNIESYKAGKGAN